MRALRLGCDPSGSGSSFLQSVRLELFIGLGCLCCLSTLKSSWTPSNKKKQKRPHLSLAAALHKPAPGPCRDCHKKSDTDRERLREGLGFRGPACSSLPAWPGTMGAPGDVSDPHSPTLWVKGILEGPKPSVDSRKIRTDIHGLHTLKMVTPCTSVRRWKFARPCRRKRWPLFFPSCRHTGYPRLSDARRAGTTDCLDPSPRVKHLGNPAKAEPEPLFAELPRQSGPVPKQRRNPQQAR